MNNQKNRFWTFILSLMPGAGEMYFGLYRQGVSLMLCFFVVLLVPLILQVSALSLLCIILWFYSFLHTHNLRSMPLDEFCQLEDRYLWEGLSHTFQWNSRNKWVVAVALIVIGAFLLWENLFAWLGWFFGGFLGNFFYRLPRAVIGVLVLLLGIRLITGKKRELEQEEQQERQAPPQSVPTYAPVYTPDVNFRPQAPAAPQASNVANVPQTPDVSQAPAETPAAPEADAATKEGDDHADA